MNVDVFLSRDSWRTTTKEVSVGDWADFDFEPIETTSGDLSGGTAGRAEHVCSGSRKTYITDRNSEMLEEIKKTGNLFPYLAQRVAKKKHSVSFSRDISSCMMCKCTGGACIGGCTCTIRVRRQLLSFCMSTQSQCNSRSNTRNHNNIDNLLCSRDNSFEGHIPVTMLPAASPARRTVAATCTHVQESSAALESIGLEGESKIVRLLSPPCSALLPTPIARNHRCTYSLCCVVCYSTISWRSHTGSYS